MLIDNHEQHHLALAELRRFQQKLRRVAGLRGKFSVCLTTDEEIRSLNFEFRGVDKPTDVLSFPSGGDEESDFPMPQDAAAGDDGYLGDIVISLDTAARQSEEMGHELDQEVRILMLHGALHLAGFDHETDQGEMRERENQLREQLGLTHGLIARADQAAGKRTPEKAAAGPRRRSRPAAGKTQ